MNKESLQKFLNILNDSPFVPAGLRSQFLSVEKLNKEGFDKEDITRGLQDLTKLQILVIFKTGYPTKDFFLSRKSDPKKNKKGLKRVVIDFLKSASPESHFSKIIAFILDKEKAKEYLGEDQIISSNIKAEFDDETATLKINSISIQLPSHKDEHYFCRAIFKYLPNEPVDWSLIFKEMTGCEERKGKDKDKRKVYDAFLSVNKRILKMTGLKDFFRWDTKSAKRTY